MIDNLRLVFILVTGGKWSWGGPNILMITVEDLGWGDVSWNNPEVVMPNIATLASSGVILGTISKKKLLKTDLLSKMLLTYNLQVDLHKLPC